METALAAEPGSVTTVAAGGLADFDAVVREHQPAVFRFLLVSLREREPAENLTQECFLRAYQARRSFRGDASVRTWLMRIAVNLVNDHRKSARLRFWRRAAQTSLDVAFTGDWLADRRSSPEAEASAREQVQRGLAGRGCPIGAAAHGVSAAVRGRDGDTGNRRGDRFT